LTFLDFGLPNYGNSKARSSRRRCDHVADDYVAAMMTGVGMLLGTAAYMSPEQAKGRPADKRSDIWAFGCVLYEMLSGKGPFAGDDVSDTLANVLKREPDWSELPATCPFQFVRAPPLYREDRRKRVADVSNRALRDRRAGESEWIVAAARLLLRRPLWRRIAILTTGAVLSPPSPAPPVWFATRPADPVPPRVERFTIRSVGYHRAHHQRIDGLAITPDGSRLIYVGNRARSSSSARS